jgi:uncharacterized protein YfaT (DUF1175 family)
MWTNPRDGSHGINALTGSTDPNDDNGHGTRVAGVIGAVGNNGLGVVGVAWRVQLMACKFVNSFGYWHRRQCAGLPRLCAHQRRPHHQRKLGTR